MNQTEKRIFIGWLANWDDVRSHPATSWTSQMTVPRELGLTNFNGEIALTQQPGVKPTYEIEILTPKSGVIGLEGFVRVGYNADTKKLFVNEYEAPYEPLGEMLHIKVVIDRSSVELFTGDGVRSISLATFPPGRNYP
jgi:sucrose-6-phosphate hydrolase SacC (GH32 family)